MKKPRNHRKISTIVILIVLASGIALLGVRSRWVAAWTHPAATAATAAQGCTLNCSATVPATGTINTAVQFTGDATPSGCTTTPAFIWDFGDGSANSSQQNPTHTYTTAGTYSWTLTTTVGSGGLIIDTIAGGLGEGAPARQGPFGTLGAIARDPGGRGVYVADATENATFIRFINTSNSTVTLGGRSIAPGTVRAIAGGGGDFTNNNIPGLQADVGTVTGLAVSPNGALVYYTDAIGGLVRAVNVSAGSVTFGGQSIVSGRVGTLAAVVDSSLNGLTTHPTTGDVYVIDAASGVNKVLRITNAGVITPVAGNGANTNLDTPFVPGPATGVPLREPRAIRFDGAGNLFIADSGHGRVIRVDTGGAATLVHQFAPLIDNNNLNRNPYPSGLAVVGSNIYVANGNQHAIWRVTGGLARIAGNVIVSAGATVGVPCDYSTTNCGDDGPALSAGFKMLGNGSAPPLAGIDGDQNGLFVNDQESRGRVRYINLSGGAVTHAGLSVAAGAIRTIAGSGLQPPYDGGLAIGASLSAPTGVAVDGAGNLWISDTNSDALRFVNRGSSPVTIFNGTSSAQTVPAGAIVTVNNGGGAGGDNVPVNQATFDSPQGLFVTSQGVYVVDSNGGDRVPATINGEETSLLKFINTTSSDVTIYAGAGGNAISVAPGNIAVIAGGSGSGASSGFAKAVTLKGASDVAVSPNGAIYITDVRNRAVRKIDGSTGIVSTVTLPASKEYTGLGITSDGRLLVANFTDGSVHRESSQGSGVFSTIGGVGGNLMFVRDVAGAAGGFIYATIGPASPSSGNHRIVQISSTGATSVIAGGAPGFDGDGNPASGGRINIAAPRLVIKSVNGLVDAPETVNIVVGQNGDIIFTDTNNNRIRIIAAAPVTCVRTGTITIAGNNPVPVLTSLDPNSRLNNSGAFTLRALGSNFAPSSVVRWNGVNRMTTFESATELNASIPATDLATVGGAGGTAQVTVFTPAPGGGTSNALTFTIIPDNPKPSITSISPNTRVEGSPGFLLTVNGTGFINGSVVRWDGSPRTTTFDSPTKLTAQIDATDLIGVGQVSVTVFNPAPGGGVSLPALFDVTQPNNPLPVLNGISPTSTNAGASAFTLTANGSSFSLSSKVRWNGQDLQTAFVGAAQLTADVPASLVANAGTAQVTVFTPAPGGGTSAAQTFTINQPRPPSVLRVTNASGAPGSSISVPVELVSQGDENAMGFSLSYPAATLTNTQAVLGADAASAQLNVNTSQAAQGRLGITLALPAGQKFTAGGRQIVVLTFTIASNAPGGNVSIDFTDQPIVREVADVTAGTLQANYVSGVVTVTQGFEADVNPRPNGNGSLTISDWVLLGRFAAGLDTVAPGSEFQRADCAPRNTLGNGSVTLSDWVQAGRYAAGLDPITPAGGPTGPPSGLSEAGGGQTQSTAKEQAGAARAIRAVASSDEPNSMTVYLEARGDENAISFSLQYDPSRARFAGAELGPELGPNSANATLLVNIRKLASGRVGLMLALPAGQSLRAGAIALLTVRFTMAPGGTPNRSRVSFGDEPITRAAVDVNAQTAEAAWADVDLAVNARAAVSVSAANFTAGALAPDGIVAAFGDGLATTTQGANSLPLPLELAGTRVVTRDSAGIERPAPLFFISASQINYLMPTETAPGPATVTITSGDGGVFMQMVEIEPIAPGLFTANADGRGVAAAVALRVRTDGSTNYEPVAQYDGAQGRYAATPVELGGEGDQVYLLLFGTGIGSVTDFGSLDAVKATIGGVEARVTYAGAQGGFAGLAQINLLLPRSLAGRGEMDLNFSVAGRAANTVKVHIR
jgi:uncharacterized protein (TIGR03437 family)